MRNLDSIVEELLIGEGHPRCQCGRAICAYDLRRDGGEAYSIICPKCHRVSMTFRLAIEEET